MEAEIEFLELTKRFTAELKDGETFVAPSGFKEVPEAEITTEDRHAVGEAYTGLGISKYVREFADGSKVFIVHSSYDRNRTFEVRPDGNKLSIRVPGTSNEKQFSFLDAV